MNTDAPAIDARPAPAPPAPGRPVRGWGPLLAMGACVAIVGSAALGLIEFGLVFVTTRAHFRHDAVPLPVIACTIGKLCVSHTLLWLPVMLAATILYGAAGGRRAQARPQAVLPAVFIALAGLVVVPADLAIVHRSGAKWVALGCGAALGAALAAYLLLRALMRVAGERGVGRIGVSVTAAFGGVTLLSGILFARSPLRDAATFRLPPSERPYTVVGGRPHVLWIVLDTARADHLGCYDPTRRLTPFLDEWAQRALVFEQAVSSGNWTAPAHASMFTGLPLRQHRFDNEQDDLPGVRLYLPDGARTVAEVLREAGYATGMFSNNPLVNRDMNLAQGFERCEAVYHLRRLAHFSLESLYERWGLTWRIPWIDGDYGAALTNELVSGWLAEQTGTGRPTFVFINYMECHLPYRVPRRYRELCMSPAQADRSYALRWTVYGNLLHAFDLNFSIGGGDFTTPADREVVRRQYAAGVRYLDDRVGEILEHYRQRGMLDNTLVVITSDHGEHLDTHGLWGHRLLLWQDLIHVALLIREPGRTQGERRALPAQLADLYQTVINAARGTPQSGPAFDARDLLSDPAAAPPVRIAISEFNGPERSVLRMIERSRNPAAAALRAPRIAAVEGRWKYVEARDGGRELYDLHADPGELNNLIAERPAEADRLAAYLAAWRAAVPDEAPWGAASQPGATDVRSILREIGYIGDH